jgi:hypothetical protein
MRCARFVLSSVIRARGCGLLLASVALAGCTTESSDSMLMSPVNGGGVGGGAAGAGAGAPGSSGMGGSAGRASGGRGGSAGMSGSGGSPAGGSGGGGGSSGMGGSSAGSGGGSAGMGGSGGGGGGSAGMGGSGGMAGGGAGTSGSGGMGGSGAGATFTAVYAIISAKCGGGQYGCHVTGNSGSLQMPDKNTAHMNLVGKASNECDGETRGVANNPGSSLLVKAVEGTACIDRMPDGRDPLSASEISTIKAWIMAGAMND